jgi:CheY-like chemotaxis protein
LEEDGPVCITCGKGLTSGQPRFRLPEGESHVRCHEGPRVLVIEDDSALLELIVQLVQRAGYKVSTATSGQQALSLVPAYTFDLILCDLRMPVMDGPEFYRQIESRFPQAASRVIFMSAHTQHQDLATFLTESGVPVLEKPFTVEELGAVVARMAGPPKSKR